MNKSQDVWNKFWRDKNGRIVIWQPPNLALAGWLVIMATNLILKLGNAKPILEFLGTALLFTWAYLEVTAGVNYFRKTVGLVVVAYLVLSHLM